MELFLAFLIFGIVILAIAVLFAAKRQESLDQTFDTASRKNVSRPLDEESPPLT